MPLDETFLHSAAMSCKLIYRMGGLHSALLSLREICSEFLTVHRINAIYVPADVSVIINIADTNSHLQAPSTVRRPGQDPPVLLWQKMGESITVDNLDRFKSERLLNDPETKDLPFLIYRSMARIPLSQTSDYTFLLNFWSENYDAFGPSDLLQLEALTAPLAEELGPNLWGSLALQPSAVAPQSSHERLCMCPGLAQVRSLVEQVAPKASTVLITGETGVGKEFVANAIHELSPRKSGPLVHINCGAIPETLLDSELFGYEKGAFTGAATTRRGYFEAAHSGTIVLDEIGEMSPSAQVRLLRVLENGYISRVGNPTPMPIDVRVVASTHDDLHDKVRAGSFRKDLWYRLTVFPIAVPPLRQRKGDIPALLNHFINIKGKSLSIKAPVRIPDAELASLYSHDWPGNVRELEHVVERAMIKGYGLHGHLHFEVEKFTDNNSMSAALTRNWPTMEELTNRYVRAVLDHCRGKLTGEDSATEILGIHYTTLRARMRQLGLSMPRQK